MLTKKDDHKFEQLKLFSIPYHRQYPPGTDIETVTNFTCPILPIPKKCSLHFSPVLSP